MNHCCRHSLTIMLALLLALIAPAAAGAQEQQATVSVTAGIGGVVTIALCDTSADFGDGLTPDGAAPINATDAVRASFPGPSWEGAGRFYVWTPSCAAGEVFLQVQSSVNWDASFCASENPPGGANLSVAGGDLRWANRQGFRFELPGGPYDFDLLNFYHDINSLSNAFPTTCEPGNWATNLDAGARAVDLRFALRVDLDAGSGDFASTVTWNVTPS